MSPKQIAWTMGIALVTQYLVYNVDFVGDLVFGS